MNEELVVKTYADMVYKIAYRYTANPTDAEDVFSETFLAYFKKDRAFESEEHRKAWLIRVTINCAKEFLGNKTPWAELNEELAEDPDRSSVELRMDLREAILLYYIEGLSVKEVAEVLGRKVDTVKVHLSRAREKLRDFLEV